MSERGAISPEREEIVDERGAELSGAIWSDFERWSGGSEHPRERGAEILTAQLRSHALLRPSVSFCSASALAKNFHFNAFLRSTEIKVYSLGINTYSSDQIVAVASISSLQ